MLVTKLVLGVLGVAAFFAAGCNSSSNGPRLEDAPIDGVQVISIDTSPPQYELHVQAGLPSGCTSPHSHEVERDNTTIRVKVLNSHTGAEVCTAIYGMYDLTIPLPGPFQIGVQYRIQVNDEGLTFTAE
jgi:hypothetical protein